MCNRLCGLCTYGLKAHVREMSTLPKLNFGHGTPLLDLKDIYFIINTRLYFSINRLDFSRYFIDDTGRVFGRRPPKNLNEWIAMQLN